MTLHLATYFRQANLEGAPKTQFQDKRNQNVSLPDSIISYLHDNHNCDTDNLESSAHHPPGPVLLFSSLSLWILTWTWAEDRSCIRETRAWRGRGHPGARLESKSYWPSPFTLCIVPTATWPVNWQPLALPLCVRDIFKENESESTRSMFVYTFLFRIS